MIINQGPLPNDGVSFSPSIALPAWITGTQVYGLGATAFKGGSLQFVYSQTDPPATNTRTYGMLWFRRGDGRTYVWDNPFMPSQTGTSDATANWMCISDRRDIWMRANDVQPGEPLQLGVLPSNAGYFVATNNAQWNDPAKPLDPTWRLLWHGTKFSESNSRLGNYAPNFVTPLWFISLDTAVSDANKKLVRCVEIGFCNVLCVSGSTGTAGELGLPESSGFTATMKRTFQRLSYYESVYSGQSDSARAGMHSFFCHAIDSSASNPGDNWLRPAFKIPMAPYDVAC
jgi:hypothetical protein